ncbi:MAG: hypothetical protein AB4352_00925 [Hormoscilla sp.]
MLVCSDDRWQVEPVEPAKERMDVPPQSANALTDRSPGLDHEERSDSAGRSPGHSHSEKNVRKATVISSSMRKAILSLERADVADRIFGVGPNGPKGKYIYMVFEQNLGLKDFDGDSMCRWFDTGRSGGRYHLAVLACMAGTGRSALSPLSRLYEGERNGGGRCSESGKN